MSLGYPGVFSDRNDYRARSCLLSVGITDQQVITLINHLEEGLDTCEHVKLVAEAAIATMCKG